MAVKVVTAPEAQALNIDEVKLWARIDSNDEDSIISLLIDMATERFQHRTGKQLLTAVLQQSFSSFADIMEIAKAPLISVSSVEYKDEDGAWQTFDAANYIVNADASPGFIKIREDVSLPDLDEDDERPVRVNYSSGYGASFTSIPADIRHLLMVMVATAYMQRESIAYGNVTVIKDFFDNYMNSHRIMRV